MFNGIFHIPQPVNEPILQYAPGSPERAELKAELKKMLGEQVDVPMIIGGKEVRNGKLADIRCPHNHRHLLGRYHEANAAFVIKATWSSCMDKLSSIRLELEKVGGSRKIKSKLGLRSALLA